MESTPLLGREREYNDVLRFIEERLLLLHCKSLFVFGACGSGKTSTVLRAVRRVTHRVMTHDKPAGRSSSGNCRSRVTDGGESRRETKTPSTNGSRKGQSAKRPRGSDGALSRSEGNGTTSAPAGGDISLGGTGIAAQSDTADMFPRLFGNGRRVQCHYVNCADMNARQLSEAITETLLKAKTRSDAHTRALCDLIECLPKKIAASRGSGYGNARRLSEKQSEACCPASTITKSTMKTMLHVLVLDEVEYLRTASRGVLAALAEISVENASHLALIFISNHREFVHVPHALLKELPFEAYSVNMLESIGNQIVASADLTRKEKDHIRLSPGLIAYIARKTLVEFSGDVRQVSVMCRRIIHTAAQDGVPADSCGAGYPTNTTRDDKERAGAMISSEKCTANPVALVTLAHSQKVLSGPAAVGDRVFEYVAAMPEQMLYVLSCLVVLTLRQQKDSNLKKTSVGGVSSSGRRSKVAAESSLATYAMGTVGSVAPGTFTIRAVHRLYTVLMGQQRFPSMNAAGISSAIDGFADIGIISRPQRRGNEEVFSFNGTWTLESMQAALVARGEALRQERMKCGVDSAENRFEEVMRELKGILTLW
uniref:Uncharacterized protein n=1 Tax=Trypanosoma congolense (strain IL3000) TaxID=1068625 RepID=G0UTE3_TRYCI|nr:conserved hypothetical protein [Trypanosoma congolense IL3000]